MDDRSRWRCKSVLDGNDLRPQPLSDRHCARREAVSKVAREVLPAIVIRRLGEMINRIVAVRNPVQSRSVDFVPPGGVKRRHVQNCCSRLVARAPLDLIAAAGFPEVFHQEHEIVRLIVKVAEVAARRPQLNFFRNLGTVAAVVIGAIVLLSIAIKNFWCRYLCPYGALLGLAALASPLRIRRSPNRCIDCAKCARACPAALPDCKT